MDRAAGRGCARRLARETATYRRFNAWKLRADAIGMRWRRPLGIAFSFALGLFAHPGMAHSSPNVRNGRIAFVTWYDHPSLAAIWPDGTGRTELTAGSSGYASPAWSPDGRKLLFVNAGTPTGHQIFLINADGTGL